MPRDEHVQWKASDKKPQVVSDAMMEFPANVCGTLLPLSEDIPEEIRECLGSSLHDLFAKLFFGHSEDRRKNKSPLQELAEQHEDMDPKFHMKEGIDGETAYRHLMCCLGSYQPQHEHKEAGCVYLMYLWFEKVEWRGTTYEMPQTQTAQ